MLERSIRLVVHCSQASLPVWKVGPLADPFPTVPSWEAVREQLGWPQPAKDQGSAGR